MKIETRVFGTIEIDDSKIIHFPGGIIGFPEMKDFALVHDEEKGKDVPVRWLQSIQEPQFAMPVMDPLLVSGDYNPEVEDELLKSIEALSDQVEFGFFGGFTNFGAPAVLLRGISVAGK